MLSHCLHIISANALLAAHWKGQANLSALRHRGFAEAYTQRSGTGGMFLAKGTLFGDVCCRSVSHVNTSHSRNPPSISGDPILNRCMLHSVPWWPLVHFALDV
jgi:hypothetical protein